MSKSAEPPAGASVFGMYHLAGSLAPWIYTIRLPFIAFLCGVLVSHESIWWMLGLLIALVLIENHVGYLQPLLIPISLIMYYFGLHRWFACILLGYLLNWGLVTLCLLLHTRNQIYPLLSDLLSPRSSYSIEELDIPFDLVQGFPTYQKKQILMRLSSRFIKLPYEKPVRIFRFRPCEEDKATGAAAAFCIENYASLIFVRQSMEDLTDAQRFQLYHELAHGTREASLMFMRGLRWRILNLLNLPFFSLMALMCLLSTNDWHRWLSLSLLMVAFWLRHAASQMILRMYQADNESIADLIALAHPDFATGDKWKKRAENLAKRLEDEAQLITNSNSRYFMVTMRAYLLRRSLKLEKIYVNAPYELDLRFLAAFLFLVLSGYFARVQNSQLGITFYLILILFVISIPIMLLNMAHVMLIVFKLHAAISEKSKDGNLDPAC